MYDDRDLDAILDEALATYTDVEPDPYLRRRILSRAVRVPTHHRQSWLFAGAAAACMAALLLALLLSPSVPAPRQIANSVVPAPPLDQSSTIAPVHPPLPVARRAAVLSRHIRGAAPATSVRSASFPSPSPLTAEETALLKFISEHPEQARNVLAIAPPKNTAPLSTAPIFIAPIHIASLSQPEEPQL